MLNPCRCRSDAVQAIQFLVAGNDTGAIIDPGGGFAQTHPADGGVSQAPHGFQQGIAPVEKNGAPAGYFDADATAWRTTDRPPAVGQFFEWTESLQCGIDLFDECNDQLLQAAISTQAKRPL